MGENLLSLRREKDSCTRRVPATLAMMIVVNKIYFCILGLGGGGRGGRDYHTGNRAEILAVSLRSVNFRFWSRLGCSEQNTIIFSRKVENRRLVILHSPFVILKFMGWGKIWITVACHGIRNVERLQERALTVVFNNESVYCDELSNLAELPGGGTSENSWWGCSALFSKSWPDFRPKGVIFLTRFQTRPLKSIPVFEPGL